MADDPKDPSAKDDPKDPAPKPKDDSDDLGEAGKRALEAERKARKAAEKSAKDAEARLKEITDKDKSETDKLRDERDAEKKRADAAEARSMRLEVAIEKGLTDDGAKRLVSQAKRLQGATREELEADADDFFASISPADDKGKPPGGKPRESLRGGGDPTDEPVETDPVKLAAMVDTGV